MSPLTQEVPAGLFPGKQESIFPNSTKISIRSIQANVNGQAVAGHQPERAFQIEPGDWLTRRSVVSADSRKLQKALLWTFITCASFYLSAGLSGESSLAGAGADTGSPFRTRKKKLI